MKRKALFVGINTYNDTAIADLSCAIADAAALGGLFTAMGFETRLVNDPKTTCNDVLDVFDDFTGDLGPGDVFLFYFAGHGFTKVVPGGRQQLLVGRDDNLNRLRRGSNGGISYGDIESEIERRGCHAIIILDACRSDIRANVARSVADPTRDLLPMPDLRSPRTGGGSKVVMRSCRIGQCSHEVAQLGHGLFTHAVETVIRRRFGSGEAITFNAEFNAAIKDEMKVSAPLYGITDPQEPEFLGGGEEPCLWQGARQTPQPAVVSPSRPREGLYKIVDLATGTEEHLDFVPPGGWTDEYKTTKLVLRRVEPGTFTMGSPTDEEGRFDNETPHRVTLTKPYYMGVFAVTQGQWKRVVGGTVLDQVRKVLQDDTLYLLGGKRQTLRELWGFPRDFDPSHLCFDILDDLPMYNVNWDECVAFCGKASHYGRVALRLPTEAEWEFACRAGGQTAIPGVSSFVLFGERNAPALDDIAWYGGNSSVGFTGRGWDTGGWPEKQYPGGSAAPRRVGLKRANAWGLHDMIGNVWEWCADWYGEYGGDATDPKGPASGEYRVSRGGSWDSFARYCRSANRDRYRPGRSYGNLGFRLCCSAGPSE